MAAVLTAWSPIQMNGQEADMPTYSQLRSESWWGREIVTDELDQFGDWMREHFGLPADAIGNKGNNVHLNGSHRSQEWIKNSRYCTNTTYTVQPGLTAEQQRHIAGEDITPNSTADMLLMSKRLDTATRTGQLEEVLYWYGNLGGDQRVDGYDNIRNVAASSDSSHLWHLHLSFDRRVLRNLAVMRRVFAVLSGTNPTIEIAPGGWLMALSDLQQADMYRRITNIDKILWYVMLGGVSELPEALTGGSGAGTPIPPPITLVGAQKLLNPTPIEASLPEAQYNQLRDDLLAHVDAVLATKIGQVVEASYGGDAFEAGVKGGVKAQLDDNPLT